MGVMLDIIASMAVRGAIIYIVLSMNVQLHNLLYEKSQHVLVKQNLAVLTDVMRNDVRYIGYNVSSGNIFQIADSNNTSFLADINNDGSPDTLQYFTGALSEMAGTPNPNDRKLYRRVNSASGFDIALGVTRFFLEYYDNDGVKTTNPADIRSFMIKLVMQGDRQINGYYPTSFWENHFFPSNI